MYFDELSSSFEVLTYTWLKTSKNFNVIENILTSLASILPLLPKTYDENLISKVTPMILNLCKKSNVKLAASRFVILFFCILVFKLPFFFYHRVLSLILTSATDTEKEPLKLHLEQIHHVLLDMVSVAPFEATREVLLAHYEVLQCFRAIVLLYPDESLDR